MSWLFSRALVAEYSADNFLGGEPSAPSNSTPTPQAYLLRDKTTAAWRRFPSGMTCEPLTGVRGEELLMSFRAGFHAKTSAPQERAPESTASEAGCGRKWHGSLAKYDPVSRSWKTPGCCQNEDLAKSLAIFPQWGTTVDGELFQLRIPYGLLAIRRYITDAKEFGLSLRSPTPSAAAAIQGINDPDGRRGQTLLGFARCQPWHYAAATPTARDWRSGKASQATMDRNSRPLSEQVGGQLNPPWVEWLMGWPIGWTGLEPLATDKFQQWRRSHGDC